MVPSFLFSRTPFSEQKSALASGKVTIMNPKNISRNASVCPFFPPLSNGANETRFTELIVFTMYSAAPNVKPIEIEFVPRGLYTFESC